MPGDRRAARAGARCLDAILTHSPCFVSCSRAGSRAGPLSRIAIGTNLRTPLEPRGPYYGTVSTPACARPESRGSRPYDPQVERLDDPSLVGVPLAVTQFNSGGFVAVSYEARAAGIR